MVSVTPVRSLMPSTLAECKFRRTGQDLMSMLK